MVQNGFQKSQQAFQNEKMFKIQKIPVNAGSFKCSKQKPTASCFTEVVAVRM